MDVAGGFPLRTEGHFPGFLEFFLKPGDFLVRPAEGYLRFFRGVCARRSLRVSSG